MNSLKKIQPPKMREEFKKPMVLKQPLAKDMGLPVEISIKMSKVILPGLYKIYWPVFKTPPVSMNDFNKAKHRCVFNLTKSQTKKVLRKIKEDPQMPYEDILEGMSGTMFGDVAEIIQKIK